jgi:D-alanyl-lipoteichoic acid acyltransferase DltB (MBOAT superfamily)
MAFNSFVFAVFLPLVIGLYWLMRRSTVAQNWMLLVASYVFYGWWDWRFLTLLFASTLVDHFVAIKIHALHADQTPAGARRRRALLSISLITNLGLLGFFKYFNFFAGSMAALLASVGIEADPFYLNIILPVGISFYSFQTLSYTIDVYRAEMPPAKTLRDFALYVAFFPQLVAGPIERAVALVPQIERPRRFDRLQFMDGLHLIFWGLFKKIYVADNLAPLVNATFANPNASGFEVLLGIYGFAFQIYGDFSGYSDVARGCSKLMGFELMHNFAFPYVSVNPSDFWRRWHISLSTWLRDYLYVPLGGNRHGTWKTYRNLSLTMLLGGLWHGATWMFVIWGAYQGLLLVVHRLATHGRAVAARVKDAAMTPRTIVWRVARVLVMFQFICIGWLFFRAESVSQAGSMLSRLLTWSGSADLALVMPLLTFVGPLVLVEALLGLSRREALYHVDRMPGIMRAAAYGVLFYLTAFHGAASQSFIYFQF